MWQLRISLKTLSRSLRHFLLGFILAVVFPGLLLGLALSWWSAQQLVDDQEQQARRLASATAENVGNYVNSLFTAAAVFSQLPLGKEHFADFYRVAKGFSGHEGYHVTLADSDGNQFLSTRLPFGAPLPQRSALDSVHKAVASGRPHASEVFLGKMAGGYVVTVDVPVQRVEGLRIITLSADAKTFAAVLLRTKVPEDWLLGLIDVNGVFIGRSKDQDTWIGKPTRPELIEASSRAGDGILYNKSVEGFSIVNVFNRVPGTDWTVLVGIPESVLYAPVKGPIGRLVGLIVAVTLIITLLIFFFYRRINIAITRLLNLAEDPLRSDKWATGSVSFAEFDAVGEKLKTVAVQQQHAIAALSQSEERYRTLFESIDEGFCILEMIYDEHKKPVDWRFLEVNPAFEKQNGLHEAAGKRMRELAPDIEQNWFDIYGNVALTGEPIRFQNEAKALGGRWFDLYAFRLGGPGSHNVAVLFNDITKAKHLDEELHAKNADLERATAVADKANLAKSEFLTNMSHDLRTPLNAILGFAQLMESGTPAPTPSQKRSLGHIIKGGWFLLSLISEILDLAAIETGELTLSCEPVLLSDIVFECIGMAENEAQKREIYLTVHQFDNAWTVHADQTRLKQVLNNLLSNAIKYNHRQGTVDVKCTVSGPERIRVSVKDNGIGLSPEKLSQLFQPFNRLGQEAGAEEGTGLGLALSKRMVEAMGGSLCVESSEGAGSEFWFELIRDVTPLAAVRRSAAAIS